MDGNSRCISDSATTLKSHVERNRLSRLVMTERQLYAMPHVVFKHAITHQNSAHEIICLVWLEIDSRLRRQSSRILKDTSFCDQSVDSGNAKPLPDICVDIEIFKANISTIWNNAGQFVFPSAEPVQSTDIYAITAGIQQTKPPHPNTRRADNVNRMAPFCFDIRRFKIIAVMHANRTFTADYHVAACSKCEYTIVPVQIRASFRLHNCTVFKEQLLIRTSSQRFRNPMTGINHNLLCAGIYRRLKKTRRIRLIKTELRHPHRSAECR